MADALLIVREPIEYTQNYETARWYRSHLSVTGTFEMKLAINEKDGIASFVCDLPSTITAADLSSGFGGVAYGNQAGEREVGKKDSFRHSVPAAEVFKSLSFSNVEDVSTSALKRVESFATRQIDHRAESLAQYLAGDGYSGAGAGALDGMFAFLHSQIAAVYKLRSDVKRYREEKLAFRQGQLAARRGISTNPYDCYKHGSDGDTYGQVSKWGDGLRFERNRLAASNSGELVEAGE